MTEATATAAAKTLMDVPPPLSDRPNSADDGDGGSRNAVANSSLAATGVSPPPPRAAVGFWSRLGQMVAPDPTVLPDP
eukprot:CAMPEP_0113330364 /NCGR_PEP_ID=MMETSP0010_2-20120614/21573_1 /TAXON_ID=216773 ORGANISM="Corethron hystrix, Strain 308" /NCGR_SAMPLE_ID=MMETSP0010_2 /ASSEMBLY_ACC=CAM_ASM_000155 /LENGTH=77 /DNA_ID=CAMNT_0000192873 /DNA_START=48 /DNA_END=279 /DNA_ORIENTATION=- /assembly_acc=CAM_ASM_000155